MKRGRKPLPQGKHRIARSITMSPESWEILDNLQKHHLGSEKSRGKSIEHLIRAAEEFFSEQ